MEITRWPGAHNSLLHHGLLCIQNTCGDVVRLCDAGDRDRSHHARVRIVSALIRAGPRLAG